MSQRPAHRPGRDRRLRRLRPCVALAGVCALGAAWAGPGLRPLDDQALAEVSGRDGLAFNLTGFSLSPVTGVNTTLTYAMPNSTAAAPYTLTLSNFSLSRTDDASPFTDPFMLDVFPRTGLPDVIRLTFPQNAGLTQLWHFDTGLQVAADGITTDLGNLELNNLAFQGGWLDLAPPANANYQGAAFGLATKLSLDSLVLRPRGLSDNTETLTLTGLSLADATTGGPWSLSDITRQPALFNADLDANGQPALHLQISWPTTTDPVPTAALAISNLSFVSNGVTTDLGSSHIAGVQINYMNMTLRPGP